MGRYFSPFSRQRWPYLWYAARKRMGNTARGNIFGRTAFSSPVITGRALFLITAFSIICRSARELRNCSYAADENQDASDLLSRFTCEISQWNYSEKDPYYPVPIPIQTEQRRPEFCDHQHKSCNRQLCQPHINPCQLGNFFVDPIEKVHAYRSASKP